MSFNLHKKYFSTVVLQAMVLQLGRRVECDGNDAEIILEAQIYKEFSFLKYQ